MALDANGNVIPDTSTTSGTWWDAAYADMAALFQPVSNLWNSASTIAALPGEVVDSLNKALTSAEQSLAGWFAWIPWLVLAVLLIIGYVLLKTGGFRGLL